VTFGFAGTSQYAAGCLERLLALDVPIALVLSQPDRPAGRHRRLTPPPVVDLARERGIAVHQPERAGDVAPAITAAGVRAMAICAYGQLLPASLLHLVPWLNIHPSLLPRWRGAAPIERAIMAGDAETGVAVMHVVEELDAGPIVHLDRLPIGATDDAGTLMERSLDLACPALRDALSQAATDQLEATPQATGGITYAHKLVAADRQLDPAETVESADRRIRALAPAIGATITLGGDRFVVWKATVSGSDATGPLIVPFAGGALALDVVQPSGRRSMTRDELLRGWRRPLTPVTRGT
jgi:methionyl-tRNA formyltransferase